MSMPSSPFGAVRPADLPSELLVHRYLAGELDPAHAAEIRAALEGSSEGRALLEEHRSTWANFPEEAQATMLRAIASAAPATRRPLRAWFVPVLAAAAGVLFFSLSGVDQGALRPKGGLKLLIYRERGGQTARVEAGAKLIEGDRLRFGVELPKSGYALVFGREAGGQLFPGFPSDRAATSPYLEAGLHDPLPGAVELDSSVGSEAWVFMVCEGPLSLGELSTGGEALTRARGCVTTLTPYDKGAR